MPVFENERGTYIFNSNILCMIEHMDDILTCGIDSLKNRGKDEDCSLCGNSSQNIQEGH